MKDYSGLISMYQLETLTNQDVQIITSYQEPRLILR